MESLGMKILIIGNLGYIGPVLLKHLSEQGNIELVGIDTGYFAHCLTTSTRFPEYGLHEQRFKDVRKLEESDFCSIDAVVYLAAISNDPMGNEFESATAEINQNCAVRAATLAAQQGVSHFVFASSCSIYGAAEGKRKETSPLNPLTAYARSKIGAEKSLQSLVSENFKITSLRFATACGFSSRLRLDLVLNDFVASAVTKGEIEILSDGSSWRPLVHVEDMALSIEWAINRNLGDLFLSINIGSEEWSYKILDLAYQVKDILPDTVIKINHDAQPDTRSYEVDFSLFKQLAPNHQPQVTIEKAVIGLSEGLSGINFIDPDFRKSNTLIRLNTLRGHCQSGRLDKDLYWVK